MNDWMAHLKAQGGHLSDDHHWQFPDDGRRRLDEENALVALTHLKVLECEGPDAARFLQGQTSANIDHANGEFAPLTAFCTPKGRMIANAELLRVAADRYWLLLDVSLSEPLAAQLGKYAPFYKITLRRRDDLALFGLIGSPADVDDLPELPEAEWHMALNDEIVALRQPARIPRWVLAMPEEPAIAIWNRLAAKAGPAGNRLWQRLDIDAGIAWLNAEHSDALLPQMINWEALGGISFRKGCYTGQEVVARAHFRGQVKRRLQIARIAGGTPPSQGSEIRTAAGKRVGEVFQAQAADDAASCEALIVISTGIDEDTTALYVDERELTRRPLPYALERLDPESAVAG